MNTSRQLVERGSLIDAGEPERRKGDPWASVVGVVARVTFRIVKTTAFLLLYWLRMPVMLVSQLISVPALFAWLFSMYAFPEHRTMVIMFGVMSFTAFALMFLYDSLLMWLAPGETLRIL